MAALDPSRSPDDDAGSPRSSETTALPGEVRLEISPADEGGEIDWRTWVELVALLRQHKFLPRINSLDGTDLVFEM